MYCISRLIQSQSPAAAVFEAGQKIKTNPHKGTMG
jgi:hypothetical protein